MALALLLGGAWGALVLLPARSIVRRLAVASRARALGPRRRRPRRLRLRLPGGATAVGRVLGGFGRMRAERRAEAGLREELPVAVDLVAVAVGAGCTPYLALETAAAWSPPGIAAPLGSVPRACRLGASFDDALRDLGRGTPVLRGLTRVLLDSARFGSPAGPALARLAHDTRVELRRAAEARARTVPVRLLFPLVLCVLPAFGLLTVVPALLAGFSR